MDEANQDKRRIPKRFIVLMLVATLIGSAVLFWQYRQREQLRQQHEKAEQTFGPTLEALEAGADEPETYDIDKTVRILHGIDRALDDSESLGEYLNHMARQDYRGVAPDVLKARQEILDVLKRLYAKQTELENQEATFTVTRTILSTMSLVEADLNISSGAAPKLDREQARSVLADLRQDQIERKELMNDLVEIETELVDAMTGYASVYYAHVAEWDRLVALRDRAYLAQAQGNWTAALEAARAATEMAPHETEAHLIEALALLELSRAQADENTYLQDAVEVLNRYLEKHPERTAPALLLLGVAYGEMGRHEESTLNFEQAAAYYPRQADHLTDMLNPYKVRSFLKKSKEGSLIVDHYQATMLGAGFFSPDLQLARQHFENGEIDEGQEKILDHFSRRKNQAQWNLLLSDVTFCEKNLSPHFERILVEESHLWLKTKPTVFGSKLDVAVENSSNKDLFNATLLLALRFTDMHRDDWEVFKVGETVPRVSANNTTDFGTMEIDHEVFGQSKGVDDIVTHRAILVTDDAVVWVDTDEYRLALARDTHSDGQQASASPDTAQGQWFDRMGISVEDFKSYMGTADIDLNLGFGRDDIRIELPRELALLKPTFRLSIGESSATVAPSSNTLTDKAIELDFESVANFDSKDAPNEAKIEVFSTVGNFEFDVDLKRKKVSDVRFTSR